MYYYFDLVIATINHLIKEGTRIINVKRIRRFNNIKASNRSFISFVWRNLEFLEKKGYIELFSEKPTRIWKLPESEIIIKSD